MSLFKTDTISNLKIVNWKSISTNVLKLQNRIVKQLKKNNIRQVRNLQRLILKNFATQLLVSQKLLELGNSKNFKLYAKKNKNLYLNILNLNKYIQLEKELIFSLEKNLIDNSTIVYNKFLILLWLIALLPVNETVSDAYSYNYRLYRDQSDLVKEFKSIFQNSRLNWMLIIKPNGFFKIKNRNWLLHNIFIETKFLFSIFKWKKFANNHVNDYKYSSDFIQTNKITLTKILKNLPLQVNFLFQKTKNEKKLNINPIIFYNDLILIPNLSLNKLKNVYKLIFAQLNERGLYVKKNRVWIVNVIYGFNFLGWFLQKNNEKIIININRENIKSHQLEIKRFLNSAVFLPIDKVIIQLNQKITYWQLCYCHCSNLFEVWSEMNYYLFWRIWRWCKKRHKNKGTKWLYERYWLNNKNKKWMFNFNKKYLKSYSFPNKKIIHLSSKINVCEIENLNKVHEFLLEKYLK